MRQDIEHVLNRDDQSEGSDNSSFFGDSNDSFSSSASDLTDDASSDGPASPKRTTSELQANGEVFQFRRGGLSKFYEGKSQSFACIFEATCVEDLAKQKSPLSARIKYCKSYGALDRHNFIPGPYNKKIAKKPPRNNSCATLISRTKSSTDLCTLKPPFSVYRS